MYTENGDGAMLEVSQLRKKFGKLTAVDQLTFTIKPGEIMGLIGQNGSGKTTTFRMLLNLLIPDQGYVRWDGQAVNKDLFNRIGYLPEERGLYPKKSIESQILYFAALKGKSKKEVSPLIDDWMERFKVKGQRKDKVKSLSKGNQQKVQLITTLIHEPDLIILDEPFSGLDPVNASLLEDSIKEAAARGACVIFSSHNMNNVENLCDSVIMLKDGVQVLGGSLDEIRQIFGRTKVFLEAPIEPQALKAIEGVERVETVKGDQKVIYLSDQAAGQAVFDLATQDGYIYQFSQQPPTLEEIFKEKAGEEAWSKY